MDDWITCAGWEDGPVQLAPDGTMTLDGTAYPQSAAIDDLDVDNIRLSKPAGEGQILTLKDPRHTVWFKHEGDGWLVKSDDSQRHAALRQQAGMPPVLGPSQALPPRAEAGGPYPEAPYPVPGEQQQRTNTWGVVAAIAVVAFVVLVSLFVLREPLKQWAEVRTVQEEKNLVQAQAEVLRETKEAEYQALETAIVQAHTEATEKLEGLRDASRRLEADFKKVVGLSLERIVGSPDDTPDEVDFLVVTDELFLAAWNQILNAHVGPSQFDANRKILAEIRRRIDEKQLGEADRTALKDLLYSIEEEQEQLKAQADNIRLVRTALVRHRLEGRSP